MTWTQMNDTKTLHLKSTFGTKAYNVPASNAQPTWWPQSSFHQIFRQQMNKMQMYILMLKVYSQQLLSIAS